MKKYLISTLALSLILVSTVSAASTPAPLSPAEKQAFAEERAKVQKAQLEKMKAEAQVKQIADQKEMEAKKINAATQVIQVSENLSQISERLKTKIGKMQTFDANALLAINLIKKAEESLRLAKASEDDLENILANGGTSEDIKGSLAEAKASLQGAFNYLNQAIEVLKQAPNNLGANKKAVPNGPTQPEN